MKTYVSKIYLPKKENLINYINQIYESGWLTNNGPLVQELENQLSDYLGVDNLLVTANGTMALQIAMKALDLQGDVITTPFTYVATSSALVAEKLNPVFSDIDQQTLNLNPACIESSITEKTSAILPVHVFGNACDIESIDLIAKKHNLRVIYDAAHAFGVKYNDRCIFSYGDISVVSFHATKFFHTIEGGAIVVNDSNLFEKAKAIRNYGMNEKGDIEYAGFNAKMNEFEAAMGLCNLKEIDQIMEERRRAFDYYRMKLNNCVTFQCYNPASTLNYSYIAALFQSHDEMCAIREALNAQDIYPRQYFYPSLDTTGFTGQSACMPLSRDVVDRILVLPMHSGAEVPVCETILSILKP